jgi:hypothetical protein
MKISRTRRDGGLLPALWNVWSLAYLKQGRRSAVNVSASMLKCEIAAEPTTNV